MTAFCLACEGPQRRVSLNFPDGTGPSAQSAPRTLAPHASAWLPYNIEQSPRPLEMRADGDALSLVGNDAASGAYFLAEIDPAREPVLTWEWSLLKTGKADPPLALMVGFAIPDDQVSTQVRAWGDAVERAHGVRPPLRAIGYVFGGASPDNLAESSLLAPTAVFLVNLRRNDACDGQWRRETRNIASDYRAIFGSEPPPVRAIALVGDARGKDARVDAKLRALAASGIAVTSSELPGSGAQDPQPRYAAALWWALAIALVVCIASGAWLVRRIWKKRVNAL